MSDLLFIDVETTGLDPEVNEIWEVGAIDAKGHEHQWLFPTTLKGATSEALCMGQFLGRAPLAMNDEDIVRNRGQLLMLVTGRILVGNNVQFDANFLAKLLGSRPWHYHLIDVKALVVGKLHGLFEAGEYDPAYADRLVPPWDTAELLETIGLPTEKKHAALEDAYQAKAMYEWVMP
jgi:DNA polymerase-3 subunit epsilon